MTGGDDAILRQTKGTIILHVTFAVKQDQEFGREFLKYLKVRENKYLNNFKEQNLFYKTSLQTQLAQFSKFIENTSIQDAFKKCR